MACSLRRSNLIINIRVAWSTVRLLRFGGFPLFYMIETNLTNHARSDDGNDFARL